MWCAAWLGCALWWSASVGVWLLAWLALLAGAGLGCRRLLVALLPGRGWGCLRLLWWHWRWRLAPGWLGLVRSARRVGLGAHALVSVAMC